MYSSTQISKLFNISGETVRSRSETFAEFLSPTANPGDGRTRQYTEEDVRVLTLVNEMKNSGSRFPDIRASLQNGERGEIPASAPSSALAPQERSRLAYLQSQVSELQAALTDEHEGRVAAEANAALLERQLADARAEIKALNREIGKLEANKEGLG